ALGVDDDVFGLGRVEAVLAIGRVPAVRQGEAQAGARIGAFGSAGGGGREQVVAAQAGPVGRDAGVVAAAAAPVVAAGALAELAAVFRRHPERAAVGVGDLAVAFDVRVAGGVHAEVGVDQAAVLGLGADGDGGDAFGRVEGDVEVEVVGRAGGGERGEQRD